MDCTEKRMKRKLGLFFIQIMENPYNPQWPSVVALEQYFNVLIILPRKVNMHSLGETTANIDNLIMLFTFSHVTCRCSPKYRWVWCWLISIDIFRYMPICRHPLCTTSIKLVGRTHCFGVGSPWKGRKVGIPLVNYPKFGSKSSKKWQCPLPRDTFWLESAFILYITVAIDAADVMEVFYNTWIGPASLYFANSFVHRGLGCPVLNRSSASETDRFFLA